MMAAFGNAEELYAEFSQLKQLSGFSEEWHAKYAEITAKVPYPERKFGKRYRPGALGEHGVDIGGQRNSKRVKGAPAEPTTPDSGCSGATGRSPPTYLREEQSETAKTEVTTEPWLHELSETPVFRLKIEYLNRIVHLEKQLAQYKRGKKTPGRTRSSDTARHLGDTLSPRRQPRCTADTTAGTIEEGDDDDDDDDAGSGSENSAVQHPAAGQITHQSSGASAAATVVLEDGDEETEDFLLQEETD